MALGLMLILCPAGADEIELRPDYPEKYVVEKGDTLWDISGRFLTKPWQWPEIWEANPQIENPHLIYPGDVVTLQFVDGKPMLTVNGDGAAEMRAEDKADAGGPRDLKLSPTIREYARSDQISSIPLDAIQQFLQRPRVVSPGELEGAGYVVASQDEHLTFGAGNRIYIRGLQDAPTNKFSIFRAGGAYEDPDSGQILGFEALHVADAILEKLGDPATALIVKSNREVLKGDRLLPQQLDEIPVFIPHAPSVGVDGKIISVIDGVSQISQHQIVVLNRGNADGLEPGHVLAVYQAGAIVRDPIGSAVAAQEELDAYRMSAQNNTDPIGRTIEHIANGIRTLDRHLRDIVGTPVTVGSPVDVQLPEERAGEVMVFRTFEGLSYALVMNIQRPVHIADNVTNP